MLKTSSHIIIKKSINFKKRIIIIVNLFQKIYLYIFYLFVKLLNLYFENFQIFMFLNFNLLNVHIREKEKKQINKKIPFKSFNHNL